MNRELMQTTRIRKHLFAQLCIALQPLNFHSSLFAACSDRDVAVDLRNDMPCPVADQSNWRMARFFLYMKFLS
jgi:hypothetical protein